MYRRVFDVIRRGRSFSPTYIPNLVLHLDARYGVTTDGMTAAADGERVQQWNDLSGQAHHVTQAAVNNRPTFRATGFNGGPGIDFTPPSFYRIWATTPEFLSSDYDTAMTLFVIGSQSGTDNRVALCNGIDVSIVEYHEWNRFDIATLGVNPSAWYHGAQSLTGNVRCVGISYDGSILRTIINGHLIKRAMTGNLGLDGALTVGNYSSVSGSEWKGGLGAVYMWRSAASDIQMRQMSAYLLRLYGLSRPSPAKSVCYVGDSLTAFTGVRRWPGMVADMIGNVSQSHTTVAYPGVDLLYIASIASSSVDPVLDSSQASQINVIWAGTNDMAQGTSGATTFGRLSNYCAARYAAGWDKIAVMTILPRSNAGIADGFEAQRQAFNTLVRENYASIADALIDVAADGRIGDEGDELDTTYYNDDRVHLNTTGQSIVADIAQPVIYVLL